MGVGRHVGNRSASLLARPSMFIEAHMGWNVMSELPAKIGHLLFRRPGKIIIWINYMFPSTGKVLVSKRHVGNPIMEIIYSIVFWLAVLGIIYMFVITQYGGYANRYR